MLLNWAEKRQSRLRNVTKWWCLLFEFCTKNGNVMQNFGLHQSGYFRKI
jgi:hypothetical protein